MQFLQLLIPNKLKCLLKPYFRKLLPNKICAVFWITFRCTYKCSYCPYCGIQEYSEYFPKELEKTGEEWIKLLDLLPPTSFYFSGGEPFLYKDFAYILNNLPSKHSIMGVVTNASMPISVFQQVRKKIHLNVSFHREFIDEDSFIQKILQLKKLFHISINIVATPENIPFLPKLNNICKKHKIEIHVDPLVVDGNELYKYSNSELDTLKQYCSQDRNFEQKEALIKTNIAKICSAGRNFYNIMPNGDISVCSGAMDNKYSSERSHCCDKKYFLGNISDENFKLNQTDITCFEKCLNHCDIDFCSIKILKRKI